MDAHKNQDSQEPLGVWAPESEVLSSRDGEKLKDLCLLTAQYTLKYRRVGHTWQKNQHFSQKRFANDNKHMKMYSTAFNY